MRKWLIFVLLLSVCGAVIAQETKLSADEREVRPKVALVLGGGGAKGASAVGVLKYVEKSGVPIDMVVGTSIGSIVGGLYAMGQTSEQLDSLFRTRAWADLFTGSLMGDSIVRTLRDLTGREMVFDSLKIPFRCVAVDLNGIREVVLKEGNLAQAMRASMAIPVVFKPVKMGNMRLVDGGVLNNLPVDVAREMGADYVIGVDVQDLPKGADQLQTGTQILGQITNWLCMNKYEENKKKTDIVIRVNTDGYSAASFTEAAIDTLIRRGEEAAMAHWDELVALRQKLGYVSQKRITHSIPLATPSDEEQNAKPKMRKDPQFNLGVRFDNEEAVALQANAQMPIQTKMPMDLELTLRLGKRIKAQVDWTLHPTHFFQPTISYIYRNNDMDFYEYGDKVYTLTYDQHTVKMSLFNFNVRNFNVSIGANWDYYKYRSLLGNKEVQQHLNDENVKNKGYISYQGRVWYNSENKWYFPTSGVRFQARFSYITDNFIKLNDKVGITEYAAMFRSNFSLSSKLSFQPMIYGRFVEGTDIPLVMSNFMGSEWFNQYTDGQVPFAGAGNLEMAWQNLAAAQLQVQFNPTTNNNILLRVAAGQDAEKLKDIFSHRTMLGGTLSYYYTTMLGPLGGSIGYSNVTKKFYYYINLGFVF